MGEYWEHHLPDEQLQQDQAQHQGCRPCCLQLQTGLPALGQTPQATSLCQCPVSLLLPGPFTSTLKESYWHTPWVLCRGEAQPQRL